MSGLVQQPKKPPTSSAGGSLLLSSPVADDIEISLFGSGYGEAIAVHLGAGEWLLVDSCLDDEFHAPAQIAYLQKIDVDVAADVKLILASHWHDDHVRGLGRAIETCSSARFCCSQAMKRQEFLELVKLHEPGSMSSNSGVREFHRILDVLEGRGAGRSTTQWAHADRCLYRRPANGQLPACEVYSLSPSDTAVTQAFQRWGTMLTQSVGPGSRVPAENPNYAAVVLWVRVGTRIVLLASDLENTAQNGTGWSAVLSSTGRPDGRAAVVKVSHHGSQSGDHPDVWSTLLDPDPVAVLTPFSRGRHQLPTPADICRIRGQSSRAFITAPPRLRRSRRRSGLVGRTLRETTRYVREAHPPVGHVRLRAPSTGTSPSEWRAQCFGQARPTTKLRADDWR